MLHPTIQAAMSETSLLIRRLNEVRPVILSQLFLVPYSENCQAQFQQAIAVAITPNPEGVRILWVGGGGASEAPPK